MMREFNDWVDVDGLTAAERARLERVHALLVTAGPPPELTAAIEQPPAHEQQPAHVIRFPVWRRRPLVAALAATVAVAGAAFGGGYLVGNDNGMKAAQVMSLRGQANQLASLRIGAPDQVGNSPMILTVTGLPKLGAHAYYELFTWRHGKPSYPCGGFRMQGGTTSVHLTVPYELQPGTKLVVTMVERGKVAWPGRVVMRSV
jgi:hypothetical protein